MKAAGGGGISIWGIGFAFVDHLPDNGQEHAANGDEGFFVVTSSLDVLVMGI